MTETHMSLRLPPLTLIVATTPSLGIGFKGSLPWGSLRADMAFFKRVTTCVPSSLPSGSPVGQSKDGRILNAVVMGRKTWDSIPSKFRPLTGRVNIVVSRNPNNINIVENCDTPVVVVGSIEDGLRKLQEGAVQVGRVFCIGGAQIYEEALQTECAERILRTRVMKEYECDVWFPQKEVFTGNDGWIRSTASKIDEWVGEENVGQVKREGDVEFKIEMWEKK